MSRGLGDYACPITSLVTKKDSYTVPLNSKMTRTHMQSTAALHVSSKTHEYFGITCMLFWVHNSESLLRANLLQTTLVKSKLLMCYVHLLRENDTWAHPWVILVLSVTKVIVYSNHHKSGTHVQSANGVLHTLVQMSYYQHQLFINRNVKLGLSLFLF